MEREGESDGRALRFGLSSGNELLRTRISACIGRSQSGQVGRRIPKFDSRPCQVLFSEYRPRPCSSPGLVRPPALSSPLFSSSAEGDFHTRWRVAVNTARSRRLPFVSAVQPPPTTPTPGPGGFPGRWRQQRAYSSSGRGRSKEAKGPVLGQFYGAWHLHPPLEFGLVSVAFLLFSVPRLAKWSCAVPSRPSTGFREFAGGQAGRVASPNPAGWKQTPTLAIADGVLDQQLPMEYLFSSTAPPGTGHILTAVQFAPSTSTPSSELASSWFQTALSDGRPG
jgi:hypothetical protein